MGLGGSSLTGRFILVAAAWLAFATWLKTSYAYPTAVITSRAFDTGDHDGGRVSYVLRHPSPMSCDQTLSRALSDASPGRDPGWIGLLLGGAAGGRWLERRNVRGPVYHQPPGVR